MHRLHWQPAVYNIGYNQMYAHILEKVGVFANLHQNTACAAKEGWMSVADGMNAVSEIAQEGALALNATLNVISEAGRTNRIYWTFQLLRVVLQKGDSSGTTF